MKMLIAGGGTGGHLYPGVALAEEVTTRQSGNQVLFVGTERGIEARVIPDLGYPIEFRSSVEVGWQADSSVRIGIIAAHLSNADLGDDNPGRNTVSLTIAFRPLALFD